MVGLILHHNLLLLDDTETYENENNFAGDDFWDFLSATRAEI